MGRRFVAARVDDVYYDDRMVVAAAAAAAAAVVGRSWNSIEEMDYVQEITTLHYSPDEGLNSTEKLLPL